MTPAPFFADLAEGPEGGHALWVTTSDGVRCRIGIWPKGTAGTVVFFPGRTEFAEKYGRVASDFSRAGFASVAVDWRGQGLADRVAENPNMGHVGVFGDYQQDVAAVLAELESEGLPRPFYLIGHSMGGAIGLRALLGTHPFRAAAFSAPMWGILITPALRPLAWALPRAARAMGQGERYAPGTQRDSYLATAAFEGNTLTTDPDQFAYMQRQVRHDSRLALGGPTLHWLHEALEDTRALRSVPLPATPALAAVGSDEAVIDPEAVSSIAARWPECRAEVYPGARHELLMERPDVRDAFISASVALFKSHA